MEEVLSAYSFLSRSVDSCNAPLSSGDVVSVSGKLLSVFG
jgi:hypothetical protein